MTYLNSKIHKFTCYCIVSCLLPLLISSCSLFFGGKRHLKDANPKVSFIESKKISIPPSRIENVSTKEVIRSYEKLMQSPHPDVKRQATRRLANLILRLAEVRFLRINDGVDESQLPEVIRDASFEKAAELYQSVLSDFEKQADDATIRYQLSRALSLSGQSAGSLKQLDQLVTLNPEAKELVEVEFRRGEAYFLKKEFRKAEKAYNTVLEQGQQTQYYEKALYKRGWALFKLHDYEYALENLFPLLERLLINQGNSLEVKNVLSDLIDDTYRAISLSFFHLLGHESVDDYFTKSGKKEYEDEVYQHLATLYLSQKRFQDTANTYTAFVQRHPLHDSSPFFSLKIAQVYIDGGFPSLVLPAKEKFLKSYGIKSLFWKNADESMKQRLLSDVKTNLDEVSSHYHAKAQKSKTKENYLIAADWYSHFLLMYQEEEKRAPYHFLMAEALYDAGEYKKAIEAFDHIAYQYQTYEKREQAAYNILLAYQQLSKALPKNELEVRKNYQLSMINYSLLYGDNFPKSSRAPSLLLRAAEDLIVHKKIEEAIKASEKFLALPTKLSLQQSDRARVIIANGLFDLQDYPMAEKAISEVISQNKLSTKAMSDFRELRAQTIYKQAEHLKLNDQLAEAVKEYQRLSAVEPRVSIRANADYDAITLLMKLERWSHAKVMLEDFQTRFPKHQLATTLNDKLALVYEKTEAWDQAALYYGKIAKSTKDVTKAKDLMVYSAELYEKSGKTQSALNTYKNLVNQYAMAPTQNFEVHAKLIDLSEKVGRVSDVNVWHRKLLNQYQKTNQKSDRIRFLAARSAFALTEPKFHKFKQIRLNLPLDKSLKRKKEAMNDALKGYNDVGKFKVAEFTTASTHRVGQLYQLLAKDILKSERPKGLSEEALEEYGYLIEDQAFPFEEKAINIFQTNSQRASNVIYDDWVKASYKALANLQPARYDKNEIYELWYGIAP